MGYTLGTRSRQNLERVHRDLKLVVERAIEITQQDFTVWDGARSAEEQNALYRKGASQKDGYKHKSNHQVTSDGYGHAVDLVPWVSGSPLWDWDRIYPIALAMAQAARELRVRIRWGGNWYECLNDYGTDLAAVKEGVERYKRAHPGPDYIDGPHYELAP